MAQFCTTCGEPLEEGVKFCTGCGTRVQPVPAQGEPGLKPETPMEKFREPELSGAFGEPQENPAPSAGQQRNPAPARERDWDPAPGNDRTADGAASGYRTPEPRPAPVVDPGSKVVSTGGFFGLGLLFGLPVIGWIICLILAFAPKNRNIRNYARATLIWMVIGLVLLGVLVALVWWLGGSILEYVQQESGMDLESLLSGY